jgi:cytochrome c biogenesis protein CcdA
MLGLDDRIAALGHGTAFAIVAVLAILLGLRHATDPDHLTAVSTLLAGGQRDPRRAARLGLAWGLGHATSLVAFGVPIVLFRAYLPGPLQMGAEAAVGLVIVVLAVRLLVRHHAGALAPAGHAHPHRTRSRRQAYGIGLIHGMGGSAGVGVLLLAAIPGHLEALVALALFALCTAISMAVASTTLGLILTRDAVARRYLAIAPALGVLSLAFGIWYALGAVDAVPYVF